MNKHTSISASLWLVVALTTVPVYAQTGGVKAKIPFNFAVSGKMFPAGEYTMIVKSHQVNIEDGKRTIVAMVSANEVSGRSAGENGRLIFHCYHDRCFLAEVWSPTQDNGRELPTSRTEANLAKEEQAKYFAFLGEKTKP